MSTVFALGNTTSSKLKPARTAVVLRWSWYSSAGNVMALAAPLASAPEALARTYVPATIAIALRLAHPRSCHGSAPSWGVSPAPEALHSCSNLQVATGSLAQRGNYP